MGRVAHEHGREICQHDRMAERNNLIVDTNSVSTGSESVGLPGACTAGSSDYLYLYLIRLARTGSLSGPVQLRSEDLDVLARATGMSPDGVQRRLETVMEPVA